MSASIAPHQGPAMTRERSITRTPSSEREGGVMGARIAQTRGVTLPGMAAKMVGMRNLRAAFSERILVLDGAMGTMIQAADLTAEDFGGASLEGCNEHLNLTRPAVIRGIHTAYFDAGADLVSTNTFGCAPYVLGEYGLSDRAYEISLAAARIGREAADRKGDRFVIGAMGPSTRSISV